MIISLKLWLHILSLGPKWGQTYPQIFMQSLKHGHHCPGPVTKVCPSHKAMQF